MVRLWLLPSESRLGSVCDSLLGWPGRPLDSVRQQDHPQMGRMAFAFLLLRVFALLLPAASLGDGPLAEAAKRHHAGLRATAITAETTAAAAADATSALRITIPPSPAAKRQKEGSSNPSNQQLKQQQERQQGQGEHQQSNHHQQNPAFSLIWITDIHLDYLYDAAAPVRSFCHLPSGPHLQAPRAPQGRAVFLQASQSRPHGGPILVQGRRLTDVPALADDQQLLQQQLAAMHPDDRWQGNAEAAIAAAAARDSRLSRGHAGETAPYLGRAGCDSPPALVHKTLQFAAALAAPSNATAAMHLVLLAYTLL